MQPLSPPLHPPPSPLCVAWTWGSTEEDSSRSDSSPGRQERYVCCVWSVPLPGAGWGPEVCLMYTYRYIFSYIHIPTCIHIHSHSYSHTFTFIFPHIHIHIPTHSHSYSHTFTYIFPHVFTYIFPYIHIHIFLHNISTHSHTFTLAQHTHMLITHTSYIRSSHVCRVWSWGWGVHGQLGLQSTDDRLFPVHVSVLDPREVSFIAAGYGHSAVLSSKVRAGRVRIVLR